MQLAVGDYTAFFKWNTIYKLSAIPHNFILNNVVYTAYALVDVHHSQMRGMTMKPSSLGHSTPSSAIAQTALVQLVSWWKMGCP